MRYDVKYDHSMWLKKVEEKYKGTHKQKMEQLCRDMQMTYYRMSKIEANLAHFLAPEEDRLIEVLNIQDNEIVLAFHKKLEA